LSLKKSDLFNVSKGIRGNKSENKAFFEGILFEQEKY
jgi:hypothetical protein